MEPFWDPNGHGAPHAVKYESDTTVSGFAYCNEGGLNFSASAASAYSEDDADFGPGRRGKASRQDPLSHRIIEKRRRDRMNSCLADLSRLIPPQYQRKGRGRIEKTEIIEMSIRYMKQLQHQEYLHKENLYKLGYEECLQQAANYLYAGHRDICYQMVDHLKEVLKGDCLKLRSTHNGSSNNNNNNGGGGNGIIGSIGSHPLDSVSASSGSPPSSHHNHHHLHHHPLNGAFHPAAPLSQLRDMLTASDTEHSSDHHDLHGEETHDDDDDHHLHQHHDEDDDRLLLVDDDHAATLSPPPPSSHRSQRRNGSAVAAAAAAVPVAHDEDVKDLSLRRSSAAVGSAVTNGVSKSGQLMMVPRSAAPLAAQQAPVITSSSAAALAAAAAPPATNPVSSLGLTSASPHPLQQQAQRQQSQLMDTASNADFDSCASRSSSVMNHHHHHHNTDTNSSHPMRSPPPHLHHHDDDDHHDSHLHHDEPDQALRAVRLRKLSHDTTATCAHDIIDQHHANSYKFKNYIQQRFSQDTIAHHHHHDHHHDHHDRMSVLTDCSHKSGSPSPAGSAASDCKKPKLCLDFEQSISGDEKPSHAKLMAGTGAAAVTGGVNGGSVVMNGAVLDDGCKPEVSAFPMFKSMQQKLAVEHSTAGVRSPLPVAGAAGQMVPIFALHSHGRFYVPLSVEYAALVPFLNGVDLLDKATTGAAVPAEPATTTAVLPPLHSINISVNFAGTVAAAAAAAAAVSVSAMLRPKAVLPVVGGRAMNGDW